MIKVAEKYNLELKQKLLDRGYKLDYQMMIKKIMQDVCVVLDFADRTVGVCRVEVKTFYFNYDKWQNLVSLIEREIIELRMENILT